MGIVASLAWFGTERLSQRFGGVADCRVIQTRWRLIGGRGRGTDSIISPVLVSDLNLKWLSLPRCRAQRFFCIEDGKGC